MTRTISDVITPEHLNARGLEDLPQVHSYGVGVEIAFDIPRCSLDGAIMDYSIRNGQMSVYEAPFPVYEFECPLCGIEDEIS